MARMSIAALRPYEPTLQIRVDRTIVLDASDILDEDADDGRASWADDDLTVVELRPYGSRVGRDAP